MKARITLAALVTLLLGLAVLALLVQRSTPPVIRVVPVVTYESPARTTAPFSTRPPIPHHP